ncbi:MAG: Hsp70 family protein [Myxococcales bacterium]|nr:Hsp70 family protein [Myxococcales bacterium]
MTVHAIGIDLGTTNCALAASPLAAEHPAPEAFDIAQVVHPGEVRAEPLLPSFLYLPAPGELPDGALALPWAPATRVAVGRFAREHGPATPARLIESAKSWLSHARVDRRADILPWGAPDDVPKVSPLDAAARYLDHLRAAWDEAHPDEPLDEQEVVLTVPASFDAVARELTVEAAMQAGLPPTLRLLEEPQAALYAWLADRGPAWRREVALGDVILVCDIGGGTTDFSLIAVRETDGVLELERVAVGEHILLGGDNMDLALAYTVKARLDAEGKAIDDWQMRQLTHACRQAKEALLSDPDRDEFPLAIASRGRRLLGGTIRTALPRAELEAVLIDGFFPRVPADARPEKPRRLGLTTLGLPYAHDAGITRHLAAFLGRPGLTRRAPHHTFAHPTAILFNGGVTRAPLIRQRVLDVLGAWIEADGGQPLTVLDGIHPEQAVSRGAAYYAHVRQTGGVRIKGGTARAYYVGVERAGLAVPGIKPAIDALCIAPFGMEEGSETALPEPLGLYVGEAARFRFFCSAERRDDRPGAVVDPATLEELAPIETTLGGEPGDDPDLAVPVHLQARVTEIGTLELAAVEDARDRRWKLSFNVRVE